MSDSRTVELCNNSCDSSFTSTSDNSEEADPIRYRMPDIRGVLRVALEQVNTSSLVPLMPVTPC